MSDPLDQHPYATLIAKAKRWHERGLLTERERDLVFALVYVSDEPPPPEIIEHARQLAQEHGW